MKESQTSTDFFPEEKIYRPKPKKLCSFKNYSRSSSRTTLSSNSSINTNINEISMEEINNDFVFLNQNLEKEECQNEILNIFNSSLKGNLLGENIERPENPFEKNILLLGDVFFDNIIKTNKQEIDGL